NRLRCNPLPMRWRVLGRSAPVNWADSTIRRSEPILFAHPRSPTASVRSCSRSEHAFQVPISSSIAPRWSGNSVGTFDATTANSVPGFGRKNRATRSVRTKQTNCRHRPPRQSKVWLGGFVEHDSTNGREEGAVRMVGIQENYQG